MESRDEKREQYPPSTGLTATTFSLIMLPLRILRPLLPRLIPFVVFLLCIPLLMFLSGAAGWVVWNKVPVDWKAVAFLQYGEESVPFANVMLPPVSPSQPYDISLHLVLPATESNYALGNFMATIRLSTAYNESIITARRPAVLVPSHPSFAKQLLLGTPATAKLEVPLLSQFVSGTSTVRARLELGRSDAWKGIGNGQSRELSVLEATITGRVRPRGIIALLAKYPRLATFVSTFVFFFVSLLVVCGVLFIAVRSNYPVQPPVIKSTGGFEDGDDYFSSGPRFGATQKARERLETSTSTSSSSSLDDEKPQSQNGTRAHTSSLRKRRSNPALEPVAKARVKIEDLPTRRGTTPPPYPKSPYPQLHLLAGGSNSRQDNEVASPVSPSDADT